jgi:hypothetical protein
MKPSKRPRTSSVRCCSSELRHSARQQLDDDHQQRAFGTDYFTRTCRQVNILVNKNNETKYLYQDLDAAGARLGGASSASSRLRKASCRPSRVLVLDDVPRRRTSSGRTPSSYSVGTKNKDCGSAPTVL